MPKSSYSPLHRAVTPALIDGFVAVDPSATLRAWWDIELDADATDALAATARRLCYLGRSESVCTAELITGAGPDGTVARPADSADTETQELELIDLLCPGPSQSLASIAVSVTELRKQRRLIPPGTCRVTYAVPARTRGRRGARQAPSGPTPRPTLALLRLDGSNRPAITDAVAVGQALRAALQHRFGRRNGGTASATFSGRAGDEPRRDQHQHAHYLALPDRHGRRVDRLFVWSPEGFGPEEVAALAELPYLNMHEVGDRMPCALAALGTIDDLDLPELLGPARSWKSLTPFGLIRHPKKRRATLVDSPADQIRSELLHRGLPAAEQVTLEPGSWHRFRSSKVGASRLNRSSLVGARILFAEPVTGPLALGAFSHYGLGLMLPGD